MRLPLLAVTMFGLALGGCTFDTDPLLDLGIADLHVPLDLGSDAGVCPSGFAHTGELAEVETNGTSSGWGTDTIPADVDMGSAMLSLDATRVAAGHASLRLVANTSSAGLYYPADRAGSYDLFEQLFVSFAATADDSSPANDPGWEGGQPHVLVVTSDTDYFEYVPESYSLSRTPGPFLGGTVPLAGGSGWTRITNGSPDLHRVKYLAFTFTTRGAGFTVWLDNVQVGPGVFADCAR